MAWMMAAAWSALRCGKIFRIDMFSGGRTLRGGVLAVEVLGGVAAEQTLALGLGSRTAGQPLVELDDVAHLDGVGVGTKDLQSNMCVSPCL